MVGPTFFYGPQDSPLARFIRDRKFMHAWLYNGDQLFPKQLNLCTRGRNALLDLDLGPGTAYDLGLHGAAWESHLFALALATAPNANPLRPGPMRFLYCWPVVSTAQFDRLREIHELGRLAAQADWSWDQSPRLVRALRVRAFARHRLGRRIVPPPAPPRQRRLARRWAQRLKRAWLARLAQSAQQLLGRRSRPASGTSEADAPRWTHLVLRALRFDDAGRRALDALERRLTRAARRAGLLFDSRRYRAFHLEHLTARVGPPGRRARLGVDGLRLLLRRQGLPRSIRAQAERALARIRFVQNGGPLPPFATEGETAALKRLRQAYRTLRAHLEASRSRLAAHARAAFTPAVRARVLRALARPPGTALAGSFYFETEHLMETSSGFTHVGLIKRLADPHTGHPRLWMFDRVIGFHYAYPVAKLTHSVPVQILTIPETHRKRRAYRWLRIRVPRVFEFGSGRRSRQVSWVNLLVHVRHRLRHCRRLFVTPGFYYSAITWLIHHPANQKVLSDLWAWRRFTGYGYRTIPLRDMRRLTGQLLYVPVRENRHIAMGAGCPPRIRSAGAMRPPAAD